MSSLNLRMQPDKVHHYNLHHHDQRDQRGQFRHIRQSDSTSQLKRSHENSKEIAPISPMAFITLCPRWITEICQDMTIYEKGLTDNIYKRIRENDLDLYSEGMISLDTIIKILQTPEFSRMSGIFCQQKFASLSENIKERIYLLTWVLHHKEEVPPKKYGMSHYQDDLRILGVCYQIANLMDTPEIKLFHCLIALFHGYFNEGLTSEDVENALINPTIKFDIEKVKLALQLAHNHRLIQVFYNTDICIYLESQKLSERSIKEIKTVFKHLTALLKETEAIEGNIGGRNFPPIRPIGTIILEKGVLKVIGIEPLPLCFQDDEILEIHSIIETKFKRFSEECDMVLPIKFTNHRKAIILQQTLRGCANAASAMLIADAKGIEYVDPVKLKEGWGNQHTIIQNLSEVGLQALCHDEFPCADQLNNLATIEKHIRKNGSAIIGLHEKGANAHVVIFDAIDDRGVLIRDPLHGWQVTIKKEVILSCSIGFMIQLKS